MAGIMISIIIPTLNEEKYLLPTINQIYSGAVHIDAIEILVIDAGSEDNTLTSIKHLEVMMYSKPEFVLKKYESLNFGISQAKGRVLIFLDADTMLPKEFDQYILQRIDLHKIVGGAFEFSFDRTDWKLWTVQWINRIRYRFGKMYYGDQAVFCKRETAVKIGGFPEVELMESAYFCSKLKKEGKLVLIKKAVKTSPRRFLENGFFKTLWFDIMMWIRFVLTLSPSQYGKTYWKWNLKSNG